MPSIFTQEPMSLHIPIYAYRACDHHGNSACLHSHQWKHVYLCTLGIYFTVARTPSCIASSLLSCQEADLFGVQKRATHCLAKVLQVDAVTPANGSKTLYSLSCRRRSSPLQDYQYVPNNWRTANSPWMLMDKCFRRSRRVSTHSVLLLSIV